MDELNAITAVFYSRRLLLIMSIVWVVAAVALRYVPGIGTNLVTYSVIYLAIAMIGLPIVVILTLRLRSL